MPKVLNCPILALYLLTYFVAGTPVELSDHGKQKHNFFNQQTGMIHALKKQRPFGAEHVWHENQIV